MKTSQGTNWNAINFGVGCPCKGCTIENGRSPTCHCTCEKYKTFRIELDQIFEKRRKENRHKNYGDDHMYKRRKKKKV